MKYHEIANIFPMMSEQELVALANDIKETGLQNKITLYENKILPDWWADFWRYWIQ